MPILSVKRKSARMDRNMFGLSFSTVSSSRAELTRRSKIMVPDFCTCCLLSIEQCAHKSGARSTGNGVGAVGNMGVYVFLWIADFVNVYSSVLRSGCFGIAKAHGGSH